MAAHLLSRIKEKYAIEIATRWNLDDEGSGYSGFVTEFDIPETYFNQFKVENVGIHYHNELWVPAEELDYFNTQIIGEIKITKQFFGKQYQYSKNQSLCKLLNALKEQLRS